MDCSAAIRIYCKTDLQSVLCDKKNPVLCRKKHKIYFTGLSINSRQNMIINPAQPLK